MFCVVFQTAHRRVPVSGWTVSPPGLMTSSPRYPGTFSGTTPKEYSCIQLLYNEVWKYFNIRVHNFYKNLEVISKFFPQKVYMNHVSYWGPANFSGHRTKFNRPGDLAFRICVPLFVTLHWPRFSLCFCWSQETFVWAIWGTDGGDSYTTASSDVALSILAYLYRRFAATTTYLFLS